MSIKQTNIFKYASLTLILLSMVACAGGNQLRVPKKAQVDIEKKRSILVINDETYDSKDKKKSVGGEAFRAALLKEFDTALFLPKLDDKFKGIPKSISDGALAKQAAEPMSVSDALDSGKAELLKGLLLIVGKVGAYDQVVFIHSEGREVELAAVPGVKDVPKKYNATIQGAVYDVKTEKIIVAAKVEDGFAADAYVAQYPSIAGKFSKFLISGKK